MNAFPSMSYSPDYNKNEMMHTVTGRSKIKVWADDTVGAYCKHSCAINPFTVHDSMSNTVPYVCFSIKISRLHTSGQPI
jgi:hypothetical protein